MTSGLHDSALMKGQGTKIAAPKTTTIAGNTKLNLLHCRNFSLLFIHRVTGSHIRQVIYPVHFLLSQRLGRRILYHKTTASVRLCQYLSCIGVCIFILCPEALCISFPGSQKFLIRRQHNPFFRCLLCFVNRSWHKGNRAYRNPLI